MTPRSAAELDVARRLWVRAAGDASTPEEVAAGAERMFAQLRGGLGRWIGAEGYRALVERALGLVRVEHPAIGDLSVRGGDQMMTTAAVREHGTGEVADGLVALVAALIKLLGRIIGQEMGLRLVEQIGIPSPRGIVSTEAEGGRDG